MQGRLLYSSSAVETKDIEMVARELTLIYNTFAYAMTQLGIIKGLVKSWRSLGNYITMIIWL